MGGLIIGTFAIVQYSNQETWEIAKLLSLQYVK